MHLLTWITTFGLISLLAAAPTKEDDENLVVTDDFYMNELVKYNAKHDIVNVLVPLNSLNFDESESSESQEEDSNIYVFFAEADIQSDGTRDYKGLYVYKDGKVTKILPNGRDAAASGDDSKLVFFGATDGLYVYDQKTNTAEKYGSITDSIIGIAKEKVGDVIYILTENHEVFKISENGEKKEKIEDIEGAKEIVLDYSNNLYFYSDDNKPYVRTDDGVEPIQGLPEDISNARLVKPPFILEDAVPFVTDNKVYILYANGTSEIADIQIQANAKPTAYAPEATLVQYYAYHKKLYEFNLVALLMSTLTDDLSNYLNSKSTDIRTLATKTKTQAVSAVKPAPA